MDSEYWNRVNELFDRALEQPEEQRKDWLHEACKNDPPMLADVLALLEADSASQILLDGVAAQAVEFDAQPSRLGSRIGHYRVLEELGSGGMGDVFLAERADGHFDQKVALKLIKPGMDSKEILRRFESERQILAQLEHPNIARLLDGGSTDDGRPFYAMEYVVGEPIHRFCNSRRLSIDARLKLFLQVCGAVQYAQERLIVHRDLKPGNILITSSGDVKLLDFGIAKILGEGAEHGGSDMTQTGIRIMTPAYAAPEQVRGERITTATDVYALGVILFELISGRRPFNLEGKSPREVEDIIGSTDPPKPSSECTADLPASTESVQSAPDSEQIARERSLEPNRLRRRLSGDLDNICLMALRKDAERRYATAGHMKDDIQRHLDGLPIRARADTLSYRASKFLSRHMAATVTTISIVLATIILVPYYTLKLADERDRARLEADKAETISTFLASLFESADPEEMMGDKLTARQMLDRGAERVREELADEPLVQAEMMNVIGRVYRRLGLYDESMHMLEEALVIRKNVLGEFDLEVAESYSGLGDILYYLGQHDSCVAMMAKALIIKERVLGPQDPSVALELNNMGWLAYETGLYARADSLHTRALRIRQEAFGEDHQDVAESYANLASVLYSQGTYTESAALYEKAYDIRLRVLGEKHPLSVQILNNMGLVYEALEEYEKAEELYNRNLEIYTELYGADHHFLADANSFLGRINVALELYYRAEPFFREALRLRMSLGETHYLVAYDRKALGDALREQKKYADAESNYSNALKIFRDAFGDQHTYTASALLGLGQVYVYTDRSRDALPLLEEGTAIREKILPEGNWNIADARSHLGLCLARLGRYEESERVLLKAYVILKDVKGEDHKFTRRCALRLSEMYSGWNKLDRETHYRKLAGKFRN